MASRKNKQKEVGESSNPSVNFDRRHFWSEKSARNYASLLQKGIHRERRVNLSQPKTVFIEHAQNTGWMEFITPTPDAVTPLVREFYANLIEKHENYRVKVRGRMVRFDSKSMICMKFQTLRKMNTYNTKGELLILEKYWQICANLERNGN